MGLSLSQKVLLIVFLPVTFELVVSAALFDLLSKADSAREQAYHAQELSAHMNSIMALCMRRASLLLKQKANLNKLPGQAVLGLDNSLHKELTEVNSLVRNYPAELQLWMQIRQKVDSLDSRFVGAFDQYSAGNLLEAANSWTKVHSDIEEILEFCTNLSIAQRRLQQRYEDERLVYENHLKQVLIWSVILSTSFALLLAFLFNKSTAQRLKILIHNSQRLASGLAPDSVMTGTDELFALDQVYRLMHKDLQILRRKERAILENAAEIIWSVDGNMRINDLNNATTKQWGYAKEQLYGRRLPDLIPEVDQQVFYEFMKQSQDNPVQDTRFDTKLLKSNGIIADVSWAVTFSEEEQVWFCILTDITERKSLERLKQDFVEMISHDLRTPLTSVGLALDNTYTDSLAGQPSDPVIIKRAQNNLQFSLSLINELLDLERLQSSAHKNLLDAVTTQELYAKALDAVNDLAKSKGILICLPTENTDLVLDRDRIVQVLTNLLSNAIKVSPAGSKILVAEALFDNILRISVSDSGPGIPPEDLELIFDRFYQSRASRAAQGTGLGLAICKTIVESHKGFIGAISFQGQGSEFYFDLPIEL